MILTWGASTPLPRTSGHVWRVLVTYGGALASYGWGVGGAGHPVRLRTAPKMTPDTREPRLRGHGAGRPWFVCSPPTQPDLPGSSCLWTQRYYSGTETRRRILPGSVARTSVHRRFQDEASSVGASACGRPLLRTDQRGQRGQDTWEEKNGPHDIV